MDSLYQPLSLPVPFLKGEFNKQKYVSARHCQLDREDISSEFIEWIKSLGIILDHAEVFFSIPGKEYMIHKDQFSLKDFPKINWVYGATNSSMNWYTAIADGVEANTIISTPYVGYKVDEVKLLYSANIKSPSLVQAGIPHNVSNVSGFRWCISTVYSYPNKSLITWNEMIKIFNPYLIKIQDQY